MDTELLKTFWKLAGHAISGGPQTLPDAIRGELSYQATGESTGRKPFYAAQKQYPFNHGWRKTFTVCGNADEYVAGGT